MSENAARRARWRRFAPYSALLAVVALLVPVFPRPQSPGIRDGFSHIQNGMTEQQVGDLLGGPRGVYGLVLPYPTHTAVGTGSGGSHLSWWYFPDCTIEVDFDEDHRVNEKRIKLLPQESLFDKAVRWWRGRSVRRVV
jgi:hypothetical protein